MALTSSLDGGSKCGPGKRLLRSLQHEDIPSSERATSLLMSKDYRMKRENRMIIISSLVGKKNCNVQLFKCQSSPSCLILNTIKNLISYLPYLPLPPIFTCTRCKPTMMSEYFILKSSNFEIEYL